MLVACTSLMFGSYYPICWLKQNAKDEAAVAAKQLHGTESEVKALKSMTQRMILTQKELVGIYVVIVTESYIQQLLFLIYETHFPGRSRS